MKLMYIRKKEIQDYHEDSRVETETLVKFSRLHGYPDGAKHISNITREVKMFGSRDREFTPKTTQ